MFSQICGAGDRTSTDIMCGLFVMAELFMVRSQIPLIKITLISELQYTIETV